jgi:hypothetical protein
MRTFGIVRCHPHEVFAPSFTFTRERRTPALDEYVTHAEDILAMRAPESGFGTEVVDALAALETFFNPVRRVLDLIRQHLAVQPERHGRGRVPARRAATIRRLPFDLGF